MQKKWFIVFILFLLVVYIGQQIIQKNDRHLYIKQIPNRGQGDLKHELDSNLCIEGEEIIFSFRLLNSDKVLTIAASGNDYLVCRIGTRDKLELEFPEDKTDSWNQFQYIFYERGGGISNYALTYSSLIFETDTFQYEVSYGYRAVDDEEYEQFLYFSSGNKDEEKKDSVIVIEGDLNSIIGDIGVLQNTKVIKSFE